MGQNLIAYCEISKLASVPFPSIQRSFSFSPPTLAEMEIRGAFWPMDDDQDHDFSFVISHGTTPIPRDPNPPAELINGTLRRRRGGFCEACYDTNRGFYVRTFWPKNVYTKDKLVKFYGVFLAENVRSMTQ